MKVKTKVKAGVSINDIPKEWQAAVAKAVAALS